MTCSCRSRGCVTADIRRQIIFHCHEDEERKTGEGREEKEETNSQQPTANPDEQNRNFGSIQRNPKSQISNPKKIPKSKSQIWSPARFGYKWPERCRQRLGGPAQGPSVDVW